jgi:arylsulfatase A-like enzyme
VWSNPTLYAPRPRRDDEPNLVLLSVDTLRADHLPTYGYGLDTAPFIDEHFGHGGTVFDHCMAGATTTAPSHMTMFTSLPPSAHGVTDGFKGLSPKIPTLPERIRAAHLDTAAFTEDGWVSVQQGFARGFNVFAENKSADIMKPEGQVDETFAMARRWLERNRDKRFFLFLHTYQVHSPYAPPDRYRGLFAEEADRAPDGESAANVAARADYDREIRFTDDELRRLVGDLERLGIADRTRFVLTSDHGEEFDEHGLLYHGGHLYEETTRVPLMVYGPGIAAGRRIDAPVSHVQLEPTILGLLGLPVPPELAALDLSPVLRDPGATAPAGPVFSEAWVTFQPGIGRKGRRFHPPSFSIREGDRKLTRQRQDDGSFRFELYDLETDPGESNDLAGAEPDTVRRLGERIARYERRQEEVRDRFYGAATPDADALTIDGEQEQKLRALGYLE